MFKIITGLFAGPAGVVTDFFASLYGKLIGFLAIVAIIGGIGASVYFSWTHTVRMAEDAQIAAKQAQELIKDKQAEVDQLRAIDAAKDRAQQALNEAAQQATQNTDAIQAWISQQPNAPKSDDRVSSPIIQQTFDQLYGKAQ